MGKPQIAIRIPPSLLAELNHYVEQTGTSKTDVVVSAIAAKPESPRPTEQIVQRYIDPESSSLR